MSSPVSLRTTPHLYLIKGASPKPQIWPLQSCSTTVGDILLLKHDYWNLITSTVDKQQTICSLTSTLSRRWLPMKSKSRRSFIKAKVREELLVSLPVVILEQIQWTFLQASQFYQNNQTSFILWIKKKLDNSPVVVWVFWIRRPC